MLPNITLQGQHTDIHASQLRHEPIKIKFKIRMSHLGGGCGPSLTPRPGRGPAELALALHSA
ncbi:hypothetical protein Adu01nite_76400 [Paractinoplanes durhamensis]|uniref:Uncharacterized protein n=1 Tax=Paractinoplanes durhamensis TaxID=113563 RepID=A0ABQ3Z8X4_9ACTN|nr:hypothetical protein Adu01nite_76400 [Actinoplanes durhamensis]